jgi:hypothetical protein
VPDHLVTGPCTASLFCLPSAPSRRTLSWVRKSSGAQLPSATAAHCLPLLLMVKCVKPVSDFDC